ncbi:MAG: hypothetical protein WA981_12695, partial [Glaciecola sp.]
MLSSDSKNALSFDSMYSTFLVYIIPLVRKYSFLFQSFYILSDVVNYQGIKKPKSLLASAINQNGTQLMVRRSFHCGLAQ